MRSIRKRLLLLQLSAVLLVGGLGVIGAYYRVRDVFYETQDYHLEQVALLLIQQNELEDSHGGLLLPGEEDLQLIGQVWSENGTLLYSSHRDLALPQAGLTGLRTVDWDDERFRVYVLARDGRRVQVAQSMELREAYSVWRCQAGYPAGCAAALHRPGPAPSRSAPCAPAAPRSLLRTVISKPRSPAVDFHPFARSGYSLRT
jgi:hypothetical protein